MSNKEILSLLHHEVIPAIGCTEPIAVALCVARAKEILGCEPEEITVSLSKNIYKNAMAVGIPLTGMTGLPIAIALGATIGCSEYGLEVLRNTNKAAVSYAKEYMERVHARIEVDNDAPDVVYVHTVVRAQGHEAEATIQGEHTRFIPTSNTSNTSSTRNTSNTSNTSSTSLTSKTSPTLPPEGESEGVSGLISSLREVYDYAMSVDLEDVEFLLDGAKMNMAAAEKSFMGNYGHGLGRLLHSGKMSSIFGDTLFTKIMAYTSGACDARMSGAMVPVMSNSGSGNQGISCSVPVYLYAMEHNIDEEPLLRALTLSNLTEIYIKQSLGRLSALCGCVVASTGSAVGITYLLGGQYEEITYAIKNMIANISGMICDGAKPGCALKVTAGVSTAVLSASLAMQHSCAGDDEGIVEHDIDRTIHNLTRIGHCGMRETDNLILDIMTNKK